MPPVRMPKDMRKAKDPKKTLLRMLSYLKKYIPILIIVLLCILIGAYAQIIGSTALGDLVDNFILPMVGSGSADFAPPAGVHYQTGRYFPGGYSGQLLPELLDGSCNPGRPEDHP